MPIRAIPTSKAIPHFTSSTLPLHFSSLPPWAAYAFQEIYRAVHIVKTLQRATRNTPRRLSPEARALLNMAMLPMPGYKYGYDKRPMLDCSVSIRELFEDERSFEGWKEQVMLVRLGRECERLWAWRWDEVE